MKKEPINALSVSRSMLVGCFLLIVFSLTSCATTGKYYGYDKTNKDEQVSTIHRSAYNNIYIIEINSVPIDKSIMSAEGTMGWNDAVRASWSIFDKSYVQHVVMKSLSPYEPYGGNVKRYADSDLTYFLKSGDVLLTFTVILPVDTQMGLYDVYTIRKSFTLDPGKKYDLSFETPKYFYFGGSYTYDTRLTGDDIFLDEIVEKK